MITINGPDALVVAQACNRQPEVLDTGIGMWRPAKALPEARRASDTEPLTVRLQGDPRIMLEDMFKVSINLDADITQFIDGMQDQERSLLQAASLKIIRAKL
jgi:hypothetical protein